VQLFNATVYLYCHHFCISFSERCQRLFKIIDYVTLVLDPD
jgi:hypothetical protein